MKDLIIDKELEIVGRGTVYVTSLNKNKLHINNLAINENVIINGVVRRIRTIEMARNGMGVVKDTVGIIAV